MKNTSTIYFTDTTFICNKLGEDLTSNNPQIKKHKTCKISIITDDFNIPLSIRIDTGYDVYRKALLFYSRLLLLTIKNMFLLLKGSTHDSTILKEQLIDIHNKHPQIFNQTNILIADGVAEHYEN